MPVIRNGNVESESLLKAPAGWTKDQKSMLFDHVIKYGEKDWGRAVPGKTSHQVSTAHERNAVMLTRFECQEQWK